MKFNILLLICVLSFFSCENNEEFQPTFLEKIQGEYETDVVYSEWDAVYDDSGEFSYWEYYENLSTTNEIEIILTDFDTESFQLNGLYNSWLVDIPATLNNESERLEFEHEITRSWDSYRILKGYLTLSDEKLIVESTLLEHGYYFPGFQTYESYISESGSKK